MLRNPKHILILLAVIIIAAGAFFVASNQSSANNVNLNVSPDKSSYTKSEEITLTLQLTNDGEAETCVSDMSAGSIKFVSFTRNGEEVQTRSAASYFITSFPKMLEASLTTLPPGENLNTEIASSVDRGLGGQALKTTALDNDRGKATFYDVERPGDYEVELVYEYPGPSSSDCPDVFEGKTSPATATFTVTPQ